MGGAKSAYGTRSLIVYNVPPGATPVEGKLASLSFYPSCFCNYNSRNSLFVKLQCSSTYVYQELNRLLRVEIEGRR